MSCRRHRCTERCCAGRPRAEARKKRLFRSQDLMDESLVEPQHICLKECNLMLSCGKHKCQRKCHPGKCPPCLESDSNDLVCPCGRTIIEAPVRCGTKLPPCPYPCIKVVRGEYPCGHTPMPHTCHPLNEPCPPCTASVFKPCKCGKVDKVRTLCFQNDVSCGKICGLPLENCNHTCQKRCHLLGECQKTCKQICKKKRINCEHTCLKPCHGKTDCPDIPCSVSIKITCECGRKETYVTCGATSTIPSAATKTHIECDEECELLERHRQLKEAFGIVDSNRSTSLEVEKLKDLAKVATTFEELQLPYNETTLSIYAKQEKWCDQIEEILNKLMDDKARPSLHFKPMRPPQRHFIQEFAKSFNLYAEAQDREPKRSVFVKKEEDGSSSKPIISLHDALPLYQTFKELEKERKLKEFEARTTTRLINVEAPQEDNVYHAKYSGFLIKKISPGTTVEDLQRIFGQFLTSTLIVNPQYLIIQDGKDALIYPENYQEMSAGVERDLETLVGHFDFISKENFIADGVELCDVEVAMLGERLETPILEE